MKEAVEAAVAEIRAGFDDHTVEVLPDPDGGAFVLVHDLAIGECFAPSTSWVGFQITYLCPEPDVYPHFIVPTVRYVGTGPSPNQYPDGNLPQSMVRGGMMPGFNRPAVTVSRQSRNHNPVTDSPMKKLCRVLSFLRLH